jgi:hypothetical protein
MRIHFFPSCLLVLASQCLWAAPATLSEIRAFAQPVDKNITETVVEIKPTLITGEPTSSLSRTEALKLAQSIAASLPTAIAVQVSTDYTGALSPAIPANAVLVIESIKADASKVGDLVLCKINGENHIRRLLRLDNDQGVGTTFYIVGYELSQEQIRIRDPRQIIGRVLATILFDPLATPSPKHVVGPLAQ